MSERPIDRLLAIMERLRDPEHGCAWDRAQTFRSIAPYTIEEAFEVADAIERGDFAALAEELGDLLLQVVYHAQMAKEQGLFDFDAVASRIADKLIRRHPHVFAGKPSTSAAAHQQLWEEMKAAERAARANPQDSSVLAGIAASLPALTRALKLQQRAAQVGFDWPDALHILDKLEEEISELRAALHAGAPAMVEDEIGDLLFTVVNIARRCAIDPEQALRAACRKFEWRFRALERRASERGTRLHELDLDGLEALWAEAKGEVMPAAAAPRPGEAGDAGANQVQR